jgi:1,4-dihydroxy-2-naphthoate octaprenyltransferase
MEKVKALLKLSRIPFLSPGLSPFTAGIILGLYYVRRVPSWGLLIISYLGLTLIMLATYYSNEYFDYEGDLLNKNYNRFSGGSRVLSEGILPRRLGLYLLIIALILFSSLALLYARLYFNLRPYLLYMALLGLFLGVFYSAPPFRWAYRGVGEILIAFAYGWLATVSGYYIITGSVDLRATLLSLPPALTVFSVIVINEIPDYEADLKVSKKNLVVRLGIKRARILYGTSNALALATASAAGMYFGGVGGMILSTALLAPLLLYPLFGLMELFEFTGKALERFCGVTVVANALAAYPVLLSLLIGR